ncbi:MAG: HesA/MoeB/ThiF family protein [archaeon]
MRYSGHIKLPQIGKKGQRIIEKRSVSIVGVGALGTICAELLARAGIGSLALIDRDMVEPSNLQRQTLFTEDDIGKPKVSAARRRLMKVNSGVRVIAHESNITSDNAGILWGDLILDCTDNLATSRVLNDYCRQKKIPLVYAACAGTVGLVYTVLPEGPCLECMYTDKRDHACNDTGILNAAAAATGALQAAEAIKVLVGEKAGMLIRCDIWRNEFRTIHVPKNPNCPACTRSGDLGFTIQKCKTKAAYSVKPKRNIQLDLDQIRNKFTVVADTPILLVIKEADEIIVHNYGELLFKTLEDKCRIEEIAKRIYEAGK